MDDTQLEYLIQRFGGLTESYWFYDRTVELRYDHKKHVYYLVNGEELEPQSGVTSICKIIDKSEALVPWACKMMAQKLFNTTPNVTLSDGSLYIKGMGWREFETRVLEAKNAHKEHLDEAGLIGNVAHNWIEKYIKAVLSGNEEDKLHILANYPWEERARNCCLAALDWMSRHNVRWLSTERKIYSRKWKYAGTMDGLCVCDSCDNLACCPKPFTDRLSIADWKSSNSLYVEYIMQTAAYECAYEEESGEQVEDRWIIRLGKEDGEFETWHVEDESYQADITAFLDALCLSRAIASLKSRVRAKEEASRAVVKAERVAARLEAKESEKAAKALAKAEKKAATEAALQLKCKKADSYKGIRRTSCGANGLQCEACKRKYEEVHGKAQI